MFISQVTFEGKREQEEKLLSIARRKLQDAQGAQGIVTAECWRCEGADTVGYALVNKWESKADFQAWMKASHSGAGKAASGKPQGGKISKSACQYEMVEL